jgi:hypothetical protein
LVSLQLYLDYSILLEKMVDVKGQVILDAYDGYDVLSPCVKIGETESSFDEVTDAEGYIAVH